MGNCPEYSLMAVDGILGHSAKSMQQWVEAFLMKYSALLGIRLDLSDLKFVSKADGLGTIHFRYQQHHEDIPVLHACPGFS